LRDGYYKKKYQEGSLVKKKMSFMSLLLLALTVLLAACGGGNNNVQPANTGGNEAANEAGAAGGDKKLKIGVSMQNLQNEYIVEVQNAMKAKAEELGIELLIGDGEGKAEKQISQIENFITQKVDAIILNAADKSGSAPAVDMAVSAGIPIITTVTLVENQDKVLAHVGSDDVDAGKIEMQKIADLLGGKGNVAIIHGPNGHSAEVNRTIGNHEIIDKNPDMKVVAEQTANWSREEALALVENWLQTLDIQAIAAQNDEMALGAIQAVEAAGKLGKVLVVGIDAVPDAMKSVEEGKLSATVFQDAQGQGKLAVEIAVKAANGETVEKDNYVPFELVTKENLADFKDK
jgi:inositol transport system substrate-binding protein